jgi:hypothetical protein
MKQQGAWETAREVYVKQAGTWRQICGTYAKSAGTWQKMHTCDEYYNLSGENINLASWLAGQGATPGANMIVTIPTGSTVGGTIDDNYALNIGDISAYPSVTLNVEGSILGKGGTNAFKNGSGALFSNAPFTLNVTGIIASGGGAGGEGGSGADGDGPKPGKDWSGERFSTSVPRYYFKIAVNESCRWNDQNLGSGRGRTASGNKVDFFQKSDRTYKRGGGGGAGLVAYRISRIDTADLQTYPGGVGGAGGPARGYTYQSGSLLGGDGSSGSKGAGNGTDGGSGGDWGTAGQNMTSFRGTGGYTIGHDTSRYDLTPGSLGTAGGAPGVAVKAPASVIAGITGGTIIGATEEI